MDILMLILFATFMFWSSSAQSKKAKQQREQRMKQQKTAGAEQMAGPKPAPAKPHSAAPTKKKAVPKAGAAGAKGAPKAAAKASKPAKPSKAPTSKASGKPTGPKAPPASQRPDIAMSQRTLIEQRPDREQRETHTKVTASVKPLKNAFENEEMCEHRIELNPEIQYSGQRRKQAAVPKIQVRTDSEGLVQGIVWSEILGKPKAYQRREPRFYR